MSEEKQQFRTVPTSNLDFNLMLTETLWGSNLVNPQLRQILTQDHQAEDSEGNPVFDEKGRPVLTQSAYWETLSYYTRDIRLGNLTNEEVKRVHIWLDLAGDFLKEEFYKAFVVGLQRAITITEVSQSRGGFLRKILNTFITQERRSIIEPEKKRFGGKKDAEAY